MFLLPAGQPVSDETCEPIRKILERYEGEIIQMKIWSERKLAYPIKHHMHGVYVLVFFNIDTQNIIEIENDCRLSADILRLMVLRREGITEEQINEEFANTGDSSDKLTPRETEAGESNVADTAAENKEEPEVASEVETTEETVVVEEVTVEPVMVAGDIEENGEPEAVEE